MVNKPSLLRKSADLKDPDSPRWVKDEGSNALHPNSIAQSVVTGSTLAGSIH